MLPGAITHQPLATSTYSNLLNSLQANTGVSQLLANQALAAAAASNASASARQPRQDPPARVAGSPQTESLAPSNNPLQNTAQSALGASLLASMQGEGITGGTNPLAADSLRGRQQLSNMAQLQAELGQTRRTGAVDSVQSLMLLIQQQQEQQRQQQRREQQQRLLEELIREQLRRQQDGR